MFLPPNSSVLAFNPDEMDWTNPAPGSQAEAAPTECSTKVPSRAEPQVENSSRHVHRAPSGAIFQVHLRLRAEEVQERVTTTVERPLACISSTMRNSNPTSRGSFFASYRTHARCGETARWAYHRRHCAIAHHSERLHARIAEIAHSRAIMNGIASQRLRAYTIKPRRLLKSDNCYPDPNQESHDCNRDCPALQGQSWAFHEYHEPHSPFRNAPSDEFQAKLT